MKGPEISVFIPVYNAGAYLKPTLESVLNQSFTDFELLVVDDSSTDGSWLILQDYAGREPRMRILQKEHGGNVPKSWNVALPLLRGKFVFYLSQDDLLSPDCFEQMIRRQRECDADCVLPDMLRFTDNAQPAAVAETIRAYLSEAMAYAEAGILPERVARELDMPAELVDALDSDPELAEAFHALTPGRQKSYLFNLNAAKAPATRIARIEKFRPQTLAGKGALER